jgi:hypothetical protein
MQSARAATLLIAYSGASQTVGLSGVGIASGGGITFNLTTIPNFGSEKVGQSTTAKNLTITNSGGSSVTGLDFNIAGQNAVDFNKTSQCGTTLAAGASCAVSLTFKPTSTGSREATLIVTYTLGGSQLTPSFALAGTGQ